MTKLSDLDEAKKWISQFEACDRNIISQWLDDLRLVTSKEFREKLNDIVTKTTDSLVGGGPVALFVEREVKLHLGVSQRAFDEKKTLNSRTGSKAMRAFGKSPKLKLVQPQRTVSPELGSEGIIGTLLTQLKRNSPNKFYLNPGPDLIRKHHIKEAFLVTDFIGSGKRTCQLLDAFWRHGTIKSWISLGLFRLRVISYGATVEGSGKVLSHPSKPALSYVTPCPAIDTEYSERDAKSLKELFIKYDPIQKHPVDSLGFGGHAAMMVFAHGCPNNLPRILYKNSRKWEPLFYGRSNLLEEQDKPADFEADARRFERLGHGAQARELADAAWTREGMENLLVLAAIKGKKRFTEAIAIATGLDIANVHSSIDRLEQLGWITPKRILTTEGYQNLSSAKTFRLRGEKPTAVLEDSMYYPRLLRTPI